MRKSKVLFCLLFFIESVYAERFSHDDCEYSINFPGAYETRQVFNDDGESTVLAKTPNGATVKLQAECWPEELGDISVYVKRLMKWISERGFTVGNVQVADDTLGKMVIATGISQQETDKYYLKYMTIFGKYSKLNFIILEKSAIPSEDHLKFRNSIIKKR